MKRTMWNLRVGIMLFWDVPDQGTWVHLHSSDVTYHYHDDLGQWYDTSCNDTRWDMIHHLQTMQHSSSHIHHPEFIIGNQSWAQPKFRTPAAPIVATMPLFTSHIGNGAIWMIWTCWRFKTEKKQVLSCSSNLIFDDSPAMLNYQRAFPIRTIATTCRNVTGQPKCTGLYGV